MGVHGGFAPFQSWDQNLRGTLSYCLPQCLSHIFQSPRLIYSNGSPAWEMPRDLTFH